jgi:hypothetical protein
MRIFLVFLSSLNAVVFCEELVCHKSVFINHYDLEIILKPDSSIVEAKGRLQIQILGKDLEKFALLLNRDFEINFITSAGKEIDYNIVRQKNRFGISKVIEINVKDNALVIPEKYFIEIGYKGKITEKLYELNMVSADITELSNYALWVPQIEGSEFRYSLKLICPLENIVICNADFIREEIVGSKKVSYWNQTRLVKDIVLVASPHFKKIGRRFKDVTVNFYYCLMPPKLAEQEIDDIIYTLKTYTTLFGKCKYSKQLALVYSPRGGWGYKRDDLSVMSEVEAIAASTNRIGKSPEDFGLKTDPNTQMAQYALFGIRNFMGHEPCHYWWGGGVESNSLWIVEGFTQFSDIYLAETKFGFHNSLRLYLLLEMLIYKNISNETPLCDVSREQIDCHDHAYKKGSWVLRMLRYVIGDVAFFKSLNNFYLEHKDTGKVTPRDFQRCAQRYYGENLDWFFDEWVWNYYEAPRYELKYDIIPNGKGYKIVGEIVQTGKYLFKMPLEIGIKYGKKIEVKKIWTEDNETPFVFKTKRKPAVVILDPNIKVLQHTIRTEMLHK